MDFIVLPQFEAIGASYWGCQQISWVQNAVFGGWARSQTVKDHFQVLGKTL